MKSIPPPTTCALVCAKMLLLGVKAANEENSKFLPAAFFLVPKGILSDAITSAEHFIKENPEEAARVSKTLLKTMFAEAMLLASTDEEKAMLMKTLGIKDANGL